MDRPHFVNLDAAPGDVAIQWAAGKLAQAHATSGATEHGPRIVVGLTTSPKPGIWHGLDDVHLPEGDDSFVIACHKDAPELLVWGTTTRGVVYGLLELADRLAHGAAVNGERLCHPDGPQPKGPTAQRVAVFFKRDRGQGLVSRSRRLAAVLSLQ